MQHIHIAGFKDEISKVAHDEDLFFGWFNNQANFQKTYINAAWDFSYHFAAPLAEVLEQPMEDCTALEIGCGGGRLTAHAARHVKTIVGVDIHENLPIVERKFDDLGITNATFLKCDGINIPCEKDKFDLIYSFIVFQHLEHIEIAEKYINECYRCLKKGGFCMVYFGRYAPFSKYKSSWLLKNLDSLLERVALFDGYKEFSAPVNHTNLYITLPYMKKMAKHAGFSLISSTTSRRNIPLATKCYGGQHGIILKK